MNQPDYVLGHAEHELDRLSRQAELIGPVTRLLFADAGIERGMRVLDVGSGSGDVAFLAAEVVGPDGYVVGTDTAEGAVAVATARAKSRGVDDRVEFRVGDPGSLRFDEPFDAVVGRYVLIFQADPAGMLQRIAAHVAPGGVVAFHEPDWEAVRSSPPVATYDRCCRWVVETAARAGTPWNMADRLHRVFTDAGLAEPTMHMHTFIAAGVGTRAWVRGLVEIVETLVPAMEAHGVATAEEIDLVSLEERMSDEIAALGATIIGRSDVTAWSRV